MTARPSPPPLRVSHSTACHIRSVALAAAHCAADLASSGLTSPEFDGAQRHLEAMLDVELSWPARAELVAALPDDGVTHLLHIAEGAAIHAAHRRFMGDGCLSARKGEALAESSEVWLAQAFQRHRRTITNDGSGGGGGVGGEGERAAVAVADVDSADPAAWVRAVRDLCFAASWFAANTKRGFHEDAKRDLVELVRAFDALYVDRHRMPKWRGVNLGDFACFAPFPMSTRRARPALGLSSSCLRGSKPLSCLISPSSRPPLQPPAVSQIHVSVPALN